MSLHNPEKILVKRRGGYVPLILDINRPSTIQVTVEGYRAVGHFIVGQKKTRVEGYLYGDKVVLSPEKFRPLTPAFTYVYGSGGLHIFARCTTCGEDHYLNDNGQMLVNGHVVHECIFCAFKDRGAILW